MLLDEAAGNTLMKDKRINILIFSRDLTRILKRAAKECITYQTLKFSTLHKFITGKLKETACRIFCLIEIISVSYI
jgi:predicted DNA binding CopG/RHH family protein